VGSGEPRLLEKISQEKLLKRRKGIGFCNQSGTEGARPKDGVAKMDSSLIAIDGRIKILIDVR